MPYSAGPYQQMQQGPCLNLHQSPMSGNNTDREGLSPPLGGRNDLAGDIGDPLQKQFEFPMNRSDDEDEYGVYQLDSEMRHYPQVNILAC
ncbi:1-phosphatidylinositol-3-phosphate 5-kinase [Arachis hypogaea]|nr:1-phosphatidylinositol-3-phosphate 5-kinase [Arachis hypogaea]